MWYSIKELYSMLWKEKADKIFEIILEKKKAKYWNEKVWWVDSKKEYSRKQELILLERAWKIKYLKFQVPFLLQEWFLWNWNKIREIKYFADFVYLKEWDEKLTVEDSKWMRTEVYKIKRKMFLLRYGKTHYFIES